MDAAQVQQLSSAVASSPVLALALAALFASVVVLAVVLAGLLRRHRRLEEHVASVIRRGHSLAGKLSAARRQDERDEQEYWSHLRTSAAPVMITTSSGEIIAASRQLLDMLGYQSEREFVAVRALDLYADIRERDRKLMAELREHGEIRNSRFRLRRRDGSAIHVLASIRVQSVKNDKRFYEAVLADISSLIDAADQREKLQSQLGFARRLEAIGQLASGIAHELNTPIQFIGDNMHFLKRSFGRLTGGEQAAAGRAGRAEGQAELLAEVAQAFEAALEGIDRVAEIVRAMKEFAHPGDGETTSCDLNQLVRSALIVARNEYKHVAGVTTLLGAIPSIDCRKGEISKVLLNLIVNAAHAIESAVNGGRPGPGNITVRSWADERHLFLSIEDTGCGIPPTVLPRIFDPFFTTKPIGRGTGQGLAIARDIVVRHDGQLDVESTVGKGTIFTLRLPLAPAHEEPRAIEAADGALAEFLIG
jgi:PAS domain S-box-containing protein